MHNNPNEQNLILENIELSKDETHHIYSNMPLYEKRFESVLSFHPPGVAAVKDKTDAYHINTKGIELYKKRFLNSFGYYGGLAAVRDASGWHHIDLDCIDPYNERYDWVGNFQEGRCSVRDTNQNYFHIKKDGTPAYTKKYRYCGDFKYGIAVVYTEDGFAQHIDKNGILIHDKKYDELGIFHKGFATAKDNQGAFHINKNGIELYEERYRWVEPFYNGSAFVCKHNGEKLIIDQQGEIIQQIQDQNSPNIQRALRSHLMGMLVGYWNTQIIRSIVELGILDMIKMGYKDYDSLLKASQLPAPSLNMIIQVLKIWDFIDESDNFYELNYLGALLTEDHHKSLKYAALMWGDEHYQTMGKLTHALKTYQPQFEKVFGKPIFDYFDTNKEKGEIFYKALKSYALDYDNLITIYDFSSTKAILDIGGGTGSLLNTILTKNEHIEKGILFDLPSVIENAQKFNLNKSTRERTQFISGNFFEEIPIKADTIIMSRILHDLDDIDAFKILKNANNALKPNGMLLIFETIVPANPKFDIGITLNFTLLVNVGGKERTHQEFSDLLRNTRFKINSIKRNDGIISMIIAEKLEKEKIGAD